MFIEQILGKKTNPFLYVPIPFIFISLMLFNYLAIKTLNIDVNQIIQTEIASKGVNRFFIENMIPFAVGLCLLLFWVKYMHQQTITSLTTSRKKIDWNRVLFSFLIWSGITTLLTLVSYFSSPASFVWNFKPIPFLVFAIFAIILIPIQTSFEEYLFRGYLMQGIGSVAKNKFIPFITTSFLFGIMHIANPEIEKLGYIVLVYYIGTGLLLGILTLMDDGMELALGFHAANNLVGALLITTDWGALQTNSILKDVSEPNAGAEILIPLVLLYPLLLLVFSKKYAWTNWKEKLSGKIEIK